MPDDRLLLGRLGRARGRALPPRALIAAALASLLGAPLAAQTNDRVFRSWRWPQETSAARGAGWGGLTVAVPEDAGAGDVNPAALGSLTKTEAFAGLGAFGDGSAPVGDEVGSRRVLGLTGVALRLSPRWTLGLGAAHARAVRLSLAAVRLADGSTDAGELDASALDLKVAAAWRLRPNVYLGASAASSRLRLRLDGRHDLADGARDLVVSGDSRSTRVTAGVGLMVALGPRLTLGFASQSGATYELARRSESPLLDTVLDPGSRFELRRPSTFVGGVHLRFSPRWAVAAQLDFVRWSEVPARLVIANGARARDEYELRDALEPRLGAEYSLALRDTSIQLRAGLHAQAPGTLRFVGDDPAETSSFIGSDWNAAGSLGASVVTSRGLRVDLAGRFGGERPAVLASAGLRF
jgi:hypothetical protein